MTGREGRTLFIYGTLKRGQPLHFNLIEGKFIGNGTTLHPYPLLLAPAGWYPYLLNQPGKGKRVKGELYWVPNHLLEKLDEIEEVPFYYYRDRIKVVSNGKIWEVDAYFKRKPIKYKFSQLLSQFPPK